ncbi:Protein SYS1 [Rhodotorula toruloides]|nr:Protein SYS1 [Rhodotorula toruloides]
MPPAARLNFPASLRSPSMTVATTAAPQRFRVQGWDPVLIVSQIVSLQALHYLVLSLVLPALLTIFSSSDLLQYEGGGTSIALAMDWRAFTGSTVSGLAASRRLGTGLVSLDAARDAAAGWTGAAAAAGKLDAASLSHGVVRVLEYDALRGWAVALGWVIASMSDIFFLYHIVRRPTHILDFSLTLIFVHLILTIYYSSSFPTSFFFWFVVGASSVAQIVLAEQLCVKREMRDGFSLGDVTPHLGGVEMTPRFPNLELGQASDHSSKQSVSYARVPNEEDQV